MPVPQETDQRLRSWLDTNQLARERLCQAILALDERFSLVRLRQPRGGPDEGRDLEAQFFDAAEYLVPSDSRIPFPILKAKGPQRLGSSRLI
jgi:hypothetical protein